MKRNKLKNLAVVLACTMMLGTMPSSIDAGSLPAITQTVEAAAKKVTLKASNKKVCAGKTVKINAKAMKGAKLSYKSSNKKIATVNRNGVVTGRYRKDHHYCKEIKIQDCEENYHGKGGKTEPEDHCVKRNPDHRAEKEPGRKSTHPNDL